MSRIVCDKVTVAIHLRQLDDDGNTVEEMILADQNGQPVAATLYAHQLDQLPGKVGDLIARVTPPPATEAEQQLAKYVADEHADNHPPAPNAAHAEFGAG